MIEQRQRVANLQNFQEAVGPRQTQRVLGIEHEREIDCWRRHANNQLEQRIL